jgi:hypothetical protein
MNFFQEIITYNITVTPFASTARSVIPEPAAR